MKQPTYLSPRTIEGYNVVLAAEQDQFETIVGRGELDSDDTPLIVTEWKPTPEAVQTLQEGGSVYLVVLGGMFPPVRLAIAEASPYADTAAVEAG